MKRRVRMCAAPAAKQFVRVEFLCGKLITDGFSWPYGTGGDFKSSLVHVLFATAIFSVGSPDINLASIVAGKYCKSVLVLPVFL